MTTLRRIYVAIGFAAGMVIPAMTSAAETEILGVYNPATGHFTPTTPKVLPNSTTGTTTVSGEIEVTLDVKLSSSIPSTQTVTCSVSASTYDASFDNYYDASATLKRGSPNTCTVTIPYIWTVASTSDTVNLNVTLSTGSGVNSGSTDGSNSTGYTYRSSTHTFAAFPLPKNGATTSMTLNDSL